MYKLENEANARRVRMRERKKEKKKLSVFIAFFEENRESAFLRKLASQTISYDKIMIAIWSIEYIIYARARVRVVKGNLVTRAFHLGF